MNTNWREVPGEWNDEPDYEEWVDSVTGYKCYVRRNKELGTWCGYVCVGKDHTYIKQDSIDLPLSVHGGVTFVDCTDGTIGFDCGHAYDLAPLMVALMPESELRKGETYRNMAFAKEECRRLALQLLLREEIHE